MKPITEQRRQELIADCHKTISECRIFIVVYGENPDVLSTLHRNEIALASLMAVPVGYTWDRGVNCEIPAADLNDDAPLGVDLYAAPPVPVIKLPDHVDDTIEAAIGLLDVIEEYPDKLVPISKDGFSVNLLRSKLSETKRLNGIK